MSKPNVLLLMTDQQTAEAMSCAGNPWVKTPAMDRLAARGVRFTRAYCSFPLCSPARASQMTGRYPHELGIEGNVHGQKFWNLDAPKETFLINGFEKAGYKCVYAGKDMPPTDKSRSFELLCEWGDVQVSDHLVEFIKEQKKEQPFFAMGCYMNPHNICEFGSGKPLFEGGVGDFPPDEELPVLPANHAIPPFEPEMVRLAQNSGLETYVPRNFNELEWKRYIWAYYRMVEMVDKQIGRVLDALDESGMDENTIVMFTSDHGDGLGSHKWNQKMVLYEESIKVPLILAGPGLRQGTTEDELVSACLDIMPTFLDYAGLPIPENRGVSMIPLGKGEKEKGKRDSVYVETSLAPGIGNNQTEMKRNKGRCVISGKWKYTVYKWGRNREYLVDLESDPGEMVNLAVSSRYRSVLDEMRKRLHDWTRETKDAFMVPGHEILSPGARR